MVLKVNLKKVEYNKKYRQTHPERIKEINKRYYERNKEYHREYHKKYYPRNREKILRQKREHQKIPSVKNRWNNYLKGYRKNNPNKVRVWEENRKMKQTPESRKNKLEYLKKYSWKKTIEFRDNLFNYKKDKCCKICGWKEHPEILQFHHKDKAKKEFNVSSSHLRFILWDKVVEEIKKCILLCPNCHFYLHYKERKYNNLLNHKSYSRWGFKHKGFLFLSSPKQVRRIIFRRYKQMTKKIVNFATIIHTNLSDRKILAVLERLIDEFNTKNKRTSAIETYGVKRLIYGKKSKFPKEISLLK